MELRSYIDHTLLAPTATTEDIQKLCEEAQRHGFYAVCVNSCYTEYARDQLINSEVKLAVTVGFPLGAVSTPAKIAEARIAVEEGAHEIDMVINIGYLKQGRWDEAMSEIAEIKASIGKKVLKVILETCYLNEKEIKKACEISLKANADFVKTSTGFGSRGASFKDIEIMKDAVGDKMMIKASGGIRDAETARKYIELGVDRIGTSSGIKIVSEEKG